MDYQTGQHLGNYRLINQIGRGGFAKVYLGEHIYLGTRAAIKVLQVHLTEDAMNRFLNEARLIANLEHPHIVRVLEFGIEHGFPFLVMSHAPHGSLRTHIRRGNPQPPQAIAAYVKDIASALQYAHDRKIIHRDVKPDNMLLDSRSRALLSDFGLAIDERGSLQRLVGNSAGTTVYMAPEQLQGHPSIASDQYALGVVVYEWLCGALPFSGSDTAVARQHVYAAPRPLRQLVPTLSEELERLVLKALSKQPEQRFASVQEFATAFTAAVRAQTFPARNVVGGEEVSSAPGILASGSGFVPSAAVEARFSLDAPSLSAPLVFTDPSSKGSSQSHGSGSKSSYKTPVSSPREISYEGLTVPSLVSPLEITDEAPKDVYTHPTQRRRLGRRKLVVGLLAVTAVAASAGLWYANTQQASLSASLFNSTQVQHKATPDKPVTQQTTGATTTAKSTPGQTSGATSTPGTTPESQPTFGNKQNTPTQGSNPGTSTTPTTSTKPGQTPAPQSPTATPTTPASNPTPTPQVALSVRIGSVPSSVKHNVKTVAVPITTSQGNVVVTLTVTYDDGKRGFVSDDQTTNASGQTTVTWTFNGNRKGRVATLVANAKNSAGQQVSSSPVSVEIT